MARLRVLSLDGGGSWALIQVKTLIDLFAATQDGSDIRGHDVLKQFDLVIANSGGALTLGGLIENLTLAEVQSLFLDGKKRRQIFVKTGFFQAPFAHLLHLIGIGPKYDTRAKLAGIRSLLKDTADSPVNDLPARIGKNYRGADTHFVFCAFNYDRRREDFLRSDAGSLAGSGRMHPEITLSLAIHASSNAPVNYFDAPALVAKDTRYWDGAVGGYNNPVLAGIVEASANAARYGTTSGEIVALSIGTGNVALPLQRGVAGEDPVLVAPPSKSNILNDLKMMATSILDDPPDAASFIAHVLLGCPLPGPGGPPVVDGRVVRMNPLVQPKRGADVPWVLPSGLNAAEFRALVNLDMDAVAQDEVSLIAKFCDLWLAGNVANQPIRANRDTLGAEIGHSAYKDAKAAWMELMRLEEGGIPIA